MAADSRPISKRPKVKYWCANFENDPCLRHGMEWEFWLMHYQFTDTDDGNRRNRIVMNYRRLQDISVGDEFVAYLRSNTFFASGKVIAPRRQPTGADVHASIDDYLSGRKAYDSEFVYYRGTVAYENHTDPWRHPN